MSNGNELKKASIADLPCLQIGQKQCLCEISCEDCIESHVLAEGYRKQREGEWRPYKTPLDARQTGWICSSVIYDLSNGDTDFCPHCGAKMGGGAE